MDTGDDIDGFFSTERIEATGERLSLSDDDFRSFLYETDEPFLAEFRGTDYESFSDEKTRPPFVQELLATWDRLYHEPYRGITTDGSPRHGLYPPPDRAVPNDAGMVRAAHALLDVLTEDERRRVLHAIDAPEWRAWSNPEFVIHRVGLRLETLTEEAVERVHGLLRASLSPEGYDRVAEAMDLNAFLGSLTDLPTIMNARSYWFSLFGRPSSDDPWGWQLFGHHVAVNVLVVGGREVIAPVFLGAEPAASGGDRPSLFHRREELALTLAASFTPEQRSQAVVYESVLDPAMPEGRVHPADERHVAGAFQDNRVVVPEGICASHLDPNQRELLTAIAEDFLLLLPERHRTSMLGLFTTHLDRTHLAWYGATDGSAATYLRIQSPVFLGEVDHHAGVWLSNRRPEQFHVHTTLRLPNRGDYGTALLEAREASEPRTD